MFKSKTSAIVTVLLICGLRYMYLLDKAHRFCAFHLMRLQAAGDSSSRVEMPRDLPKLAESLSIPSPKSTTEDTERDKHCLRGQFLARQERWSDLEEEIQRADGARAMTPAALPVADLLCYGARADVVAAVEHALIDGHPSLDAPIIDGIQDLEEMLAEEPLNPVRAVIVAQAHMDLGWAWRGSDWQESVPQKNLSAFEAHFDRARDILTQCEKCFPRGEKALTDSPLFASATCALDANGIAPTARLAQNYERLIDLNPLSPSPMRALGTYLSPRWYGSHTELEVEARRTAARTVKEWGAGGYTWVMMDTLAGDAVTCALLDIEFFVEGLEDIMERMPDQHTANFFASYCVLTMGNRNFSDDQADANRKAICDCADWVVRNYLTELHPLIWAHAGSGFDNNLRVLSHKRFAATGKQNGTYKIAEIFRAEIEAGDRIVFTADGPVAKHS